ncbi:MAG: hypothetical protein M0C28_40040 [Candidatus Moduliflexus flocculans]|nr:hypothetical protein [Candidatus Moduliflexus flocculans]
MIRELTDQGADGGPRALRRARLGASTRTPTSGGWPRPWTGRAGAAFATGGAWLATHLWEHYRFTGDKAFLARVLPGDEGRGRVLPGLPRPAPEARMARDQPLDLARELPARARQRAVLRRGRPAR